MGQPQLYLEREDGDGADSGQHARTSVPSRASLYPEERPTQDYRTHSLDVGGQPYLWKKSISSLSRSTLFDGMITYTDTSYGSGSASIIHAEAPAMCN